MFNGLTQISGAAGTGKTQLALDAAVSLLVQSDRSCVYWFYTKGKLAGFPTERALELCRARLGCRGTSTSNGPRKKDASTSRSEDEEDALVLYDDSDTSKVEIDKKVKHAFSRLFLRHVTTSGELTEHVKMLTEQLISRGSEEEKDEEVDVRQPFIVVLDAINGLEFADRAYERSSQLFRLAAALKRLECCSRINGRVIILNGVVTNFSSTAKNGRNLKPALGLSWSYCHKQHVSLWKRDTGVVVSGGGRGGFALEGGDWRDDAALEDEDEHDESEEDAESVQVEDEQDQDEDVEVVVIGGNDEVVDLRSKRRRTVAASSWTANDHAANQLLPSTINSNLRHKKQKNQTLQVQHKKPRIRTRMWYRERCSGPVGCGFFEITTGGVALDGTNSIFDELPFLAP
ncbi:unnamed protein product [Amoebophrya sp. A25]|nr:unnamed protein product [Amoebophrya sp. A25]|eukprot:GSA25T00007024001.1